MPIKLKRSSVSGKVPTTAQVELGELALNTYDGKLYTKKNNGTETIVEIGGNPPVTSVAGKTGAVTLAKGDVGLGNVDNTSDASKPVSTATQTALNAKANSSDLAAKANLASPTFTGTPAAPTAGAGTNTTQIATTAFVQTALSGVGGAPAGSVMPYAGTSEPSGWLFARGQAVSRATYAALFSAIGTTYGAGDGSTTFALPDLRGRVVAGKDDMGGSSANRLTNQSGGLDGDVLGATGGAETHTLTTAQLASHSHTGSFSTTNTDGGSSFDLRVVNNVNTGSAGSGSAHNNVQPTIILNYIIKT